MKIRGVEIGSLIEGGDCNSYEMLPVGYGIYKTSPVFIKGFDMKGDYDKREAVILTLDEFIDIINGIEFRNNDVDNIYDINEKESDIRKLQKEFKDLGINVSLKETYVTHMIYSEYLNSDWVERCNAMDEIYCLLRGIYDSRKY